MNRKTPLLLALPLLWLVLVYLLQAYAVPARMGANALSAVIGWTILFTPYIVLALLAEAYARLTERYLKKR